MSKGKEPTWQGMTRAGFDEKVGEMLDPKPPRGMKPLTPAQQGMLDAIHDLTARFGYGPSMRELATARDYGSTHAVLDCLEILERKGCITRDIGVARSVRITPLGQQHLSGHKSAPLPESGCRSCAGTVVTVCTACGELQ